MTKPHIDRTPFVPADLPDRIKLWFCPACGRQVNGSYNLEPARARCTKTWHLTHPVPRSYVLAEVEQEYVHDAA